MTTASERVLEGPLATSLPRLDAPFAMGMSVQVTFNLVDAYVIAKAPAGAEPR